jgi:hypothetical protein
MKISNNFITLAVTFVLLMCASLANADAVYPYQTPVYIPNAVSAPIAYTAPADYLFTTNGVGTVTLRVSGTCTSLAATLKASNDNTNFTAINLYPIATGTVAPTAVASVGAVGFWKANTVGFTNLDFNITALTATCTVAIVGTPGGSFNGTQF